MNNIKISIITAIFNSYDLMGSFFESLENQTYRNFEVIVVDDCSTDDSYKKLIDYKSKSKMDIKVFQTKTNSGPGIARNIGIEKATGDYVTFVDSDDWIEPNSLECIIKILGRQMVDVIIFDYIVVL